MYVRTGAMKGTWKEDVLRGVIGQMSDGIWENSSYYDKFWKNAYIIVLHNNEVVIDVEDCEYGERAINGFYKMTEDEVREFWAKMVEKICKVWYKDNIASKLDRKWRFTPEFVSYLEYSHPAMLPDILRFASELRNFKD